MINKISILLSLIGLIDSGYLSWIKLSNRVETCIPGLGDCAAVNSSAYSEIIGIPVAYLGFAAYLAIFLVLTVNLDVLKKPFVREYLLFGITLAGFLFSAYLTYVQFGILGTYCPYCLLSAITTTTLFILSTIQLIRENNKQES